eukprot:g36035.t1
MRNLQTLPHMEQTHRPHLLSLADEVPRVFGALPDEPVTGPCLPKTSKDAFRKSLKHFPLLYWDDPAGYHDASAITFQYVLGAATSPAVKLHEETLTYLNQGQSYEIRMMCNQNMRGLLELNGKMLKSIVRVVFHDRRLQYSEHQQFQGWKWNRPGDRLLDIGMFHTVVSVVDNELR